MRNLTFYDDNDRQNISGIHPDTETDHKKNVLYAAYFVGCLLPQTVCIYGLVQFRSLLYRAVQTIAYTQTQQHTDTLGSVERPLT